MLPAVSADFDGRNQFVLKISAPAGKRFLVNVPAGRAVTFGGQLNWQNFSVVIDGVSELGATAVSFDGSEGTVPGFVRRDAVLSQTHQLFRLQ